MRRGAAVGRGRSALERRVVSLAGTYTHHALQFADEYLAVAYFAGLGCFHDRVDDLIDQLAAYCNINACLGHEIDHVFGTSVQLGMSALAAKALTLGHGHA